jgi:hypothetical protein
VPSPLTEMLGTFELQVLSEDGMDTEPGEGQRSG